MFTRLLLQHLLASAYQQTSRQLPGDHHDFLIERLQTQDERERPNLHFVLDSFARLSGDQAFEAGLAVLIHGIEYAASVPTATR
jgi:hypothetical protein